MNVFIIYLIQHNERLQTLARYRAALTSNKNEIRKKRFKKNGNNDCPIENGQRLPNYPNSMNYR